MNSKKKFEEVIEAIRSLSNAILPEGSTVTLFGSRARNTAREDSDWDIHILIPGYKKLTLAQTGDYSRPFMELGLDIEEDIEPIVHSYADWESKSFLPIYKNIKKEGILL